MFPVVPTTFTASGEFDLAGQKRCVDFIFDAGSDGLCILANDSEQFAPADDERELLTREVLGHWSDGRRSEALAAYSRWLPLINHENRQCGLLAAKALMREGGVIACDAPRAPFPPMAPAARAGLLEFAGALDPMVLRWGR